MYKTPRGVYISNEDVTKTVNCENRFNGCRLALGRWDIGFMPPRAFDTLHDR